MTIDRLNADLLKALSDDGPVTMLNLMRYPLSGWNKITSP